MSKSDKGGPKSEQKWSFWVLTKWSRINRVLRRLMAKVGPELIQKLVQNWVQNVVQNEDGRRKTEDGSSVLVSLPCPTTPCPGTPPSTPPGYTMMTSTRHGGQHGVGRRSVSGKNALGSEALSSLGEKEVWALPGQSCHCSSEGITREEPARKTDNG